MNNYTIRVYVFLISQENEVLLLDEKYENHRFTKLPGGGLEPNEGIIDCLHRELKEELGLENLELTQFYASEKFVLSKIRSQTQVIAVYYWCKNIAKSEVKIVEENSNVLALKWVPLSQLQAPDLTFETDKEALARFIKQ